MVSNLPKISIKKGREWHIRRGHPWLFSGGISQAAKVIPGALVDLIDFNGNFVGRGYYNPNCDIAVRVLTLDKNENIDLSFFQKKIKNAFSIRTNTIDLDSTNVFRLINAEGDFLPGFIVDYYDANIVIQCHTAGADSLLELFVEAIKNELSPKSIILRNDTQARKREGLSVEPARIIFGDLTEKLIVRENNYLFSVDLIKGQKTGFFTDQRDKRLALAKYIKLIANTNSDVTLLNCFSYTAAFSIYAAKTQTNTKINTINIDESKWALLQAEENFQLNNIESLDNQHQFISTDTFQFLSNEQEAGRVYDFIILDPPAFARSHKDKDRALKSYKRMTISGISCLKNGGYLMLCSCSGSVKLDEFLNSIREACADSGVLAQIVEIFEHGSDHPLNLMAPETSYLKVIICRILK